MIGLSNLRLQYGDKVLIENLSLQFTPGNRYGITGANGAGKSTLLKVIAGEESAFSGEVTKPNQCKLGVLRQDHFRFENHTILNTVLMGNQELWEALSHKDEVLEKEDFTDEDGILLGDLEEIIARHDGYNAPATAATLLEGLGIAAEKHENLLSTLSGGYKLRVLMAQLLFSEPDVLLLDEPTNHLDIYSIRWLEEYLQKFKGTVLVVSHDHHFLNTVVTHIADVDYFTLQFYKGNYDNFTAMKALVLEQKEKEIVAQTKKKEQLETFVEKFKAKASFASRAQSKVKMMNKMEEIEVIPSSRQYPDFQLKTCRSPGVTPLSVQKISKSFAGNQVLKDVSFNVDRNEKIAVIGPNGIGKSTLLKIIMKEISPDSGEVNWGYETYPGYFPQDHRSVVCGDKTIFDWLSEQKHAAAISEVRGILGKVLFSGDDAGKKLSVLSGGECSRLIMAKLMLTAHNILLLDEPTNHLDLEAVEELARCLFAYEGTILLVSHNRWLVSQIANRIIEISHTGVRDFLGSYEEFLQSTTTNQDWLDKNVSLKKKKKQ